MLLLIMLGGKLVALNVPTIYQAFILEDLDLDDAPNEYLGSIHHHPRSLHCAKALSPEVCLRRKAHSHEIDQGTLHTS